MNAASKTIRFVVNRERWNNYPIDVYLLDIIDKTQ